MTTGNVLTGQRGPPPAPFTLDPEGALASLAKLEAVQATWVLPGHGAPWRGGRQSGWFDRLSLVVDTDKRPGRAAPNARKGCDWLGPVSVLCPSLQQCAPRPVPAKTQC
jgi:glyoxylase-like metal-dependent hydrolase (beta-lactamase superfamily II)